MSASRERHVVLGTGPVGVALAEELLRRGRSVRAVNRSGRVRLPERVEVVLGEHPEAFGRIWHLPSAETVSTRRFVQMVFEAAGHTPRMSAAPPMAASTPRSVQASGIRVDRDSI